MDYTLLADLTGDHLWSLVGKVKWSAKVGFFI